MSLCHPIIALALATSAALAPAAAAHEFWLAASRLDPGAGDTVTVGAVTGEGFRGERKPFQPRRAVRFIARGARTLDLKPAANPGDSTWLRLITADPRGMLIAYESDFASITLDSGKFDTYLAEDGLDAPLAARRRARASGPVRERYRRCAKTWLAGDDAQRATRPVGLPLEIVPASAPGTDSTLRVQVRFEGRPIAGVLVHAWRQPLAAPGTPRDPVRRDEASLAWGARTDARGEVVVPVAVAGEWLIGAVHMVPSRAPDADWESTWASLVFARPAPASLAGH